MNNQKLKSARELIRSPYLTPSQAMEILLEVGRHKSTEVPEYTDLPDLIVSGFEWAKSVKGKDYWGNLYDQLRENSRTI